MTNLREARSGRPLTKEQVWRRLARIQPAWEAAWAARNWAACGAYKRVYDRLWSRFVE